MFEFVWSYYFSSTLVGEIGLALLAFLLAHSTKERKNGFNDEYVRGDVNTDTVEGYFSIFKRGMKGVYQHCDANGFDDQERTAEAVTDIVWKRLTHRRDNEVIACAS